MNAQKHYYTDEKNAQILQDCIRANRNRNGYV